MAGGASRKVRADDQNRSIGHAGEHMFTGMPSLEGIGIGDRGPFRPGDLAGMVHEVAGDQRFLATRRNPHADVTGSMAGGRDELISSQIR